MGVTRFGRLRPAPTYEPEGFHIIVTPLGVTRFGRLRPASTYEPDRFVIIVTLLGVTRFVSWFEVPPKGYRNY